MNAWFVIFSAYSNLTGIRPLQKWRSICMFFSRHVQVSLCVNKQRSCKSSCKMKGNRFTLVTFAWYPHKKLVKKWALRWSYASLPNVLHENKYLLVRLLHKGVTHTHTYTQTQALVLCLVHNFAEGKSMLDGLHHRAKNLNAGNRTQCHCQHPQNYISHSCDETTCISTQ